MKLNHSERYRVRYDDLDTYRHLNNKSFITYIEDARGSYLSKATGFEHHANPECGVMIVHFEIDYRSQVLYGSEVTVTTRCARIGNKSLTLEHQLTVGETLVAEAKSTLVTYSERDRQSITVPPDFADSIRLFEEDSGL